MCEEPVNRSAFLSGCLLAALTAPALAQPATTTLRVGGTPNIDTGPALWAVQTGLFQRAGLDVELQRLNNGAAVAAAVVGGSVHLGKSSIFGLILAHAKGVPFVLESVTSVYQAAAPTNGFVVAKGGPAAPAQLSGKTIAVPALGDLYALTIAGWIDQNGGNASTVNYVELPVPLIGAPSRTDALPVRCWRIPT